MATANLPSQPPLETSFPPPSTPNPTSPVVESPSLSSSNALARFEFDNALSSKTGTKVLMVEWRDDKATLSDLAPWEISWEEDSRVRKTGFPTPGHPEEQHRLYFLLPANVSIPAAIHLRKGPIEWKTNPLPAIFPSELGASAGKKGVLHTIWAKKRLQVLEGEIQKEARDNVEGLGYEMAVAEKEWIRTEFGVVSNLTGSTGEEIGTTTDNPRSPRSPGGGRLAEKMKGLKVGTETSASNPSKQQDTSVPGDRNSLSPGTSEIAIGSFSSLATLKNSPADSSHTPAAPQPQPQPHQPPSQPIRRIQPHFPPASAATGITSLNALAADPAPLPNNSTPQAAPGAAQPEEEVEEEEEQDLFAFPLSPRSPEMTKSPFSFAREDTEKYRLGSKPAT